MSTFLLTWYRSVERRLLCLPATMHILSLGYHTEAQSTQDERHNTRTRHQHHADYVPHGRC